jgi:hypothetical protein
MSLRRVLFVVVGSQVVLGGIISHYNKKIDAIGARLTQKIDVVDNIGNEKDYTDMEGFIVLLSYYDVVTQVKPYSLYHRFCDDVNHE